MLLLFLTLQIYDALFVYPKFLHFLGFDWLY